MSECILFTGYRQHGGTGYGQMTVGGKRWLAHRYAYVRAKGEIPSGLFVCHRCNNKGCVNVDHLYLGNASINTRDAHRDGLILLANTKKKHCPKCGGAFTVLRDGRRRCMACKLENDRKHWPERKKRFDAARKEVQP